MGHTRLAALALLVAFAASCSQTPESTTTSANTAEHDSILLITFGTAPAYAFGSPQEGVPSMTPVFDGFRESSHYETRPEPAPTTALAAQGLLAEGALLKSYRAKGYRLGAFLADPTLAPLAQSFDTHVVPNPTTRTAPPSTTLLPLPFEDPTDEHFYRATHLVQQATQWLATQADIPPEELAEIPRKSGRKSPKPQPTQGHLAHPVFLWLHLAEPAFRNTPNHIHVGGASKLTRTHVATAAMDLQIGQLISFLSEHGLRDHLQIAMVGLTADHSANPVPLLLPSTSDLGLVTNAPAAPAPSHTAAIERRLRLADPNDTTLLADCEAHTQANPQNPDAWTWLGVEQLHAKHPQEALAAHQKAFDLDPKNPWRMNNLGLALLATGDVVKAIDHLENAYLAAPQNPRYKANLTSVLLKVGLAFIDQEEYSNAMACLTRVTLLQPNNPYGYFAQGRLHEKLGQPDRALAFYQKALSLQPKFKPAHDAIRALSQPPAPAQP